MNSNDADATLEPQECAMIDRLSDYIDDEMTGDTRQALEEHVRTCEVCRRTLGELRAMVARAGTLPPRVPELDLWTGIEARIARIRPSRTSPYALTLSLPQLAAAALLLIALTAGLLWTVQRREVPAGPAETARTERAGRTPAMGLPVSFADDTYDRAVSDLERTLQEGRDRLDPRTIEIVERNLATIDAAIAQARQALESDPSNTYLNTHLAQARRRKLTLLQRVSAMTNPEG